MHDDEEGTAFRRVEAVPGRDVTWGWSPKIPSMLPPPTRTANLDREDFIVGKVTNDQRRLTKGDLRRFNHHLQQTIDQAVSVDGCAYQLTRDGIVLYGVSGGHPTDDCIEIDARKNGGTDQLGQVRHWYEAAVIRPTPHPVPAPPPNGVRSSEHEDGWQPYVNTADEVDVRFEKRAGGYRCTECVGTEEPFETTNRRALSAHWRMKHDRSPLLDSAESRDKASETRRSNRYRRDMELAIELLTGSLGKEPPTEEITRLKAENADLKAQLAIIREAVGLQ